MMQKAQRALSEAHNLLGPGGLECVHFFSLAICRKRSSLHRLRLAHSAPVPRSWAFTSGLQASNPALWAKTQLLCMTLSILWFPLQLDCTFTNGLLEGCNPFNTTAFKPSKLVPLLHNSQVQLPAQGTFWTTASTFWFQGITAQKILPKRYWFLLDHQQFLGSTWPASIFPVKQRFHLNGAGFLLITADSLAPADHKPKILNSNISHERL